MLNARCFFTSLWTQGKIIFGVCTVTHWLLRLFYWDSHQRSFFVKQNSNIWNIRTACSLFRWGWDGVVLTPKLTLNNWTTLMCLPLIKKLGILLHPWFTRRSSQRKFAYSQAAHTIPFSALQRASSHRFLYMSSERSLTSYLLFWKSHCTETYWAGWKIGSEFKSALALKESFTVREH